MIETKTAINDPIQEDSAKELMKLFLQDKNPCKHLEYAIHNNFNEEKETFCDSIDMVLYHYKRYLHGKPKTLHRVMYEVRILMSNKYANEDSLDEIFNHIENKIMSIEYYEIMPLFLESKKRIKHLLSK